uniref:Uncharacterized protein n=1 Tax=Brassica oleracea TaxID=3712 RepID=A0A3P6EX07_BRAOL|nr:unnamed protein product [Brassica oleracea]
MESPVSRSESSSEAGEGSDCDLTVPLPLSCVYAAPPLVGPASSLADWRSRYSLPSSIVLRVPTPEERASTSRGKLLSAKLSSTPALGERFLL